MKFKRLFFLIFLKSIFSFGQFKSAVSPMQNYQSPNATSLGSFGDVPVSLYTGTPDISVPIHKLNERGVELDINLQYNARGVRVEDVPGWVGQNWALNAGGLITRTVRGTAYDELNFFHGKNVNQVVTPYIAEWSTSIGGGLSYLPVTQRGFFYHKDKLNVSYWNNLSYLYNLAYDSYYYTPFTSTMQSFFRAQNYRMDLEPDLFTFNFMGHTGHFFMGQDGEWKVFSDSNLKVVCNLDTDISYPVPPTPASGLNGLGPNFMLRFPKTINKITLIDDLGNKYLFDQVELTFNNFTSHRPEYNNDSRCIASAFYITKVTDVNSNILYQFEYEKVPWQAKFSVSYEDSFMDHDSSFAIVQNTATYGYKSERFSMGFGAPGQLILPSYLKKIKSESGIEINFNSVFVDNAMKYDGKANPLIDNPFNTNPYIEEFYGCSTGYEDPYFLFKNADLITDSLNPNSPYSMLWNQIKNKKLVNIKIKDNSNNQINVNLDYIDTTNVRLFLKELSFNSSKKYQFNYNNPSALPNFLSLSVDRLGYFNSIPFKFTISRNDVNYWLNELPALRQTNDSAIVGSLNQISYPTGGFTQFEFETNTYSKKITDNNILVAENGIIGGLRIKKIIKSDGEIKEYIYKKSLNDVNSSGNLLYNPIYFKETDFINSPLLTVNNNRRLRVRSLNSLTSMSNFMGVQLEYSDVFEKTTGNGYTHYKYSNYEEFPDYDPSILDNRGLQFAPKTDRSYERGKLKEQLTYKEGGILLKKNTFKYYTVNSHAVNAVNCNFTYNIGQVGSSIFYNSGKGNSYYLLPFISAYQIPYVDKSLTEENTESYNADGSVLYTFKKSRFIPYPFQTNSINNNGSIFKKQEYYSSSERYLGTLKTYQYPFDLNNSIGNSMIIKNLIPSISEKTERVSGNYLDPNSSEILSEKKLDYQIINNNLVDFILPKESFYKKGENNFEKGIIYTKFDHKGNVVEYKKENGILISVIWGYNLTKPIAVLENVSHNTIQQNTIDTLLNLSNLDVDSGLNGITENTLRINLKNLRNLFPDAMIKSYTYDSLSGVTSEIDYKNDIKYFIYDDLIRLKHVVDQQGNILTENIYNYKSY